MKEYPKGTTWRVLDSKGQPCGPYHYVDRARALAEEGRRLTWN
jgi:hypothetical protein